MKEITVQVKLINGLLGKLKSLRDSGHINTTDYSLRRSNLVAIKRMFTTYYTDAEMARVALCSMESLLCLGWRCSWSDKKLRDTTDGFDVMDACPDCESVRTRIYDADGSFLKSEINREMMDRPKGAIPMQLARLQYRLNQAEKRVYTLEDKFGSKDAAEVVDIKSARRSA